MKYPRHKTKSGIYLILNKVNGKFYIGSSQNLTHRKNAHRRNLNQNKHCNIYLQRAWNKYGEENFIFSTIERCDINDLCEIEQQWINITNSCNRKKGYNLCPVAGSIRGYKRPPRTKEHTEKCREAMKRRWEEEGYYEKSKTTRLKNKDKNAASYAAAQSKRWKDPLFRENQMRRLKAQKLGQDQLNKLLASKVKTYKIIYDNGDIEIITNLSDFARKKGFPQTSLSSAVKHSRKYKGMLISHYL